MLGGFSPAYCAKGKRKARRMNKSKHREKKKKRHERQIAEGVRQPRPKLEKRIVYGTTIRRKVKLSEIDREDVRRVLEIVKGLDIRP